MLLCLFIFVVLIKSLTVTEGQDLYVGNPEARAHPCNVTEALYLLYRSGFSPEEENQYKAYIDLDKYGQLPNDTQIELKLDSDATAELLQNDFAQVDPYPGGRYTLSAYKEPPSSIILLVKGTPGGSVPNIWSIRVNGVEHCRHPIKNLQDHTSVNFQGRALELFLGMNENIYLMGNVRTRENQQIFMYSGAQDLLDSITENKPFNNLCKIKPPHSVSKCGRRLVQHTELITHAASTKAGDWPWHAAIFKLFSKGLSQRYICGGTLISKNFVLTASHCVTHHGIPLVPDSLKVILGKYRLGGGDRNDQEIDVFEVIVHPEFEKNYLSNDIALLQLICEVVFTDYVQPICLWDSTDMDIISLEGKLGTVVGWGLDEMDALTNELAQASIPVVSDSTCLRSLSYFFDKFLRDTTYCAGFRNGTSVCNGDSGGGMVFPIEITPGDESSKTWFLRGVVSVSVSRSDAARCDPNHYAVFTDAAKYDSWIRHYVKSTKN